MSDTTTLLSIFITMLLLPSTTALPSISFPPPSAASSSFLRDACCIQAIHPSKGDDGIKTLSQDIARVLKHSGPCTCSLKLTKSPATITTADGKPIYRAVHFAGSEAYFSYVPSGDETHRISEYQGSGVFYHYLTALQEKFNCSITVDTVYEAAVMKYVNNSRYPQGKVGILEDYDYDMALPFTQDLSREQVARFSSGLLQEQIRFATKVRIGHPPRATVLWKPYRPKVWFLLIVWWSSFCTIRLIRLIWCTGGFRLRKIPDHLGRIALELLRLQLFNQLSPKFWKSRLFSGFTLLFSFLLTTLYTTKLTAYMTNPPMLNPVTFEEVEDDLWSKVYINYVHNPQQESLQASFPRIFQDHIQVSSDADCVDRLLEEHGAVCVETNYVLGLLLLGCFKRLAPAQELYGPGKKYLFFVNSQENSNTFTRAVGVYFSESFPLVEEFTYRTKIFYAQGVVHAWARHDLVVVRDINFKRGKYENDKSSDDILAGPDTIISLKNFFTVLCLCLFSYVLSALVFLAEVAFHWLGRKGRALAYNLRMRRLRKFMLP